MGDLLLSITILSRSKNSEGITQTIKALQKATLLITSNNIGKKIRFIDKTVFDNQTGTTVMTDEKKSAMIITNLKYHYALILPYYNNWDIDAEGEKYLIFLNHEKLHVSLEIFKNKSDSSKEYLEALERELLNNKDKLGIELTKIIQYKDDYILITQVDVNSVIKNENYKGIKQINYYSTKHYNSERYKLHISELRKVSEVELSNTELFNYLTLGFRIDFEHK